MADDTTPYASESEWDTDCELDDCDPGGPQLGQWLLQQRCQIVTANAEPDDSSHLELFKSTFMTSSQRPAGTDMADLDAILGELCQLETQLTSQQDELESHLRKRSHFADGAPPVGGICDVLGVAGTTNGVAEQPPPPDGAAGGEVDGLESLQNALSELSGLTGVEIDDTPHSFQCNNRPEVARKPLPVDLGGLEAARKPLPVDLGGPEVAMKPLPVDLGGCQRLNRISNGGSSTDSGHTKSSRLSGPSDSDMDAADSGFSDSASLQSTRVTSRAFPEKTGSDKEAATSSGSRVTSRALPEKTGSDKEAATSSGSRVTSRALPEKTGSDKEAATSSGSRVTSRAFPEKTGSDKEAATSSGSRVTSRALPEKTGSDKEAATYSVSRVTSRALPEEEVAPFGGEKEKRPTSPKNSIFVKVRRDDAAAKSYLVEEQFSVVEVLELIERSDRLPVDATWALVETLPDLFMERILEDHMSLVENLLFWKKDSSNYLKLTRKPEKYDLFSRPEKYYSSTPQDYLQENQVEKNRSRILQENFPPTGAKLPNIEGALYLKSEGKKSWKKFHFVLRASGLYYSPKGKGKASKDLVCLQSLEVIELFTGIGWKKKYKAPTEYNFAIKHPQIQKKAPKYIKYFSAEDEKSFILWTSGIRLARHGRQLYENFEKIQRPITSLVTKPPQKEAENLHNSEKTATNSPSHRTAPHLPVTTSVTKQLQSNSTLSRTRKHSAAPVNNVDFPPPPPDDVINAALNAENFTTNGTFQEVDDSYLASRSKAPKGLVRGVMTSPCGDAPTTAVIRRTPSSSPRHFPSPNAAVVHNQKTPISATKTPPPPPLKSKPPTPPKKALATPIYPPFYEDIDRVNDVKFEHSIQLQKAEVRSPPTSPLIGYKQCLRSGVNSVFTPDLPPPPADFLRASLNRSFRKAPPPPPKRNVKTQLSMRR